MFHSLSLHSQVLCAPLVSHLPCRIIAAHFKDPRNEMRMTLYWLRHARLDLESNWINELFVYVYRLLHVTP